MGWQPIPEIGVPGVVQWWYLVILVATGGEGGG
jgi:hypothetical protein